MRWLILFRFLFKLLPLSDFVSGMACANDADCQDVLSNTVCTSIHCECAEGFSGLGIVPFRVHGAELKGMFILNIGYSYLLGKYSHVMKISL